MDFKERAEKFKLTWLGGLTCRNSARKTVDWQSSDSRFILMCHHGHTSYVDRVAGSSYCGTYRALYDLSKVEVDSHGPHLRSFHIGFWEGRWSKSKQKELEELVKGI